MSEALNPEAHEHLERVMCVVGADPDQLGLVRSAAPGHLVRSEDALPAGRIVAGTKKPLIVVFSGLASNDELDVWRTLVIRMGLALVFVWPSTPDTVRRRSLVLPWSQVVWLPELESHLAGAIYAAERKRRKASWRPMMTAAADDALAEKWLTELLVADPPLPLSLPGSHGVARPTPACAVGYTAQWARSA
jgi:hypothetical protein